MAHLRFLAAVALLLVLTAAAGPPAVAQAAPPYRNLLPNPSFEQPTAGNEAVAAAWAPYQCGYTRSRDRSYAPDIEGPWSCRITGAGGAHCCGCCAGAPGACGA